MRRKRPTERDPQRQETSDALMMLTGMKEWRQQHPPATLREIEPVMEKRLNQLPRFGPKTPLFDFNSSRC